MYAVIRQTDQHGVTMAVTARLPLSGPRLAVAGRRAGPSLPAGGEGGEKRAVVFFLNVWASVPSLTMMLT